MLPCLNHKNAQWTRCDGIGWKKSIWRFHAFLPNAESTIERDLRHSLNWSPKRDASNPWKRSRDRRNFLRQQRYTPERRYVQIFLQSLRSIFLPSSLRAESLWHSEYAHLESEPHVIVELSPIVQVFNHSLIRSQVSPSTTHLDMFLAYSMNHNKSPFFGHHQKGGLANSRTWSLTAIIADPKITLACDQHNLVFEAHLSCFWHTVTILLLWLWSVVLRHSSR